MGVLEYLKIIPVLEPRMLFEIFLLAVFYYYIILFIRGTRGAAILSGFVVCLVTMLLLTNIFSMDTLNWLLQKFSVYMALAFLIIFQPEIRRALAELGKQHVFTTTASERTLVDTVVQAVMSMADRKIGALIAIEREIGTRSIQETGTVIDGDLTAELLTSLFYPNAPLHDGGVILSGNRIVAAGCLFPLSQQENVSKALGMRHRAALGISEDTDAISIVVSEETGVISIAYKGHMSRGYDEDRLRRVLSKVLLRVRRAKSRLSRVKEQLDLTPEGVAKTEELATEPGGGHAE